MRYAPLRERRNIRRVDMPKKGRGAATALWQVFFEFKDGPRISQSFSDSRYGGKEDALIWAMRFRDAMEQEFAASEFVYGHTGRIRSDAIGISRSRSKRGGKVWPYWQATWPGIDGRAINRKFHDKKCGGSEAARLKALAARREGIEHYRSIREGRLLKGEVYPAAAYGRANGRAPYALFMPPENPDTPVWRYMDFTKLVSLLQHEALFFPTVAALDDPFEGSFAGGNQLLRPLVYRHLPKTPEFSAGDLVRKMKHHVAASCWHLNEQESAGMWKLYAKSNEAVCIQSTFRRLRNELGEAVRVGTVRYVDYETDWIPESNELAPFLYKRRSFEFERELRALKLISEADKAVIAGDESVTPPKVIGCWQKVDLAALIEKVYIAPDAPGWLADLTQDVMRRYGYGSIHVVKSSLASSPLY